VGHRIGSFVTNLTARGVSSLVIAGAKQRGDREAPLADVFPSQPKATDERTRSAIERSRVAYLPSQIDPPRLATRLARHIEEAPAGSVRRALGIPLRKGASAYALFTYGERRGWVQRAIRYGENAARSEHFDAVLASAAAEYWNFGVAHALGKRLGLPVVLDLRDEWDIFLDRGGKRSRFFPLMNRFCSSCALVVCATSSVAASVNATWPRVRTVVVHNGIDLDNVPTAAPRQREPGAPLVVGCLGTFWANPHWSTLSTALARIAEDQRVDVVFRGRARPAFETAMCHRSSPPGLKFDLGDLVPKTEILQIIQSADVLVAAVYERSPGAIPSKIYDAIGCAKPLLVLGDSAPGYLIEHLRFCRSPWLVVDDKVGVGQIAEFLREASARPPIDPHEQREHYSRRARSDELYDLLRGVTR
jgi:hypothetical protein